MEHARGARALREGRALEQLDARVAAVATHLGLVDEAAKLYAGCGRHDLLNDLHRAGGRWDQVGGRSWRAGELAGHEAASLGSQWPKQPGAN
jgi:hypothetical protein